MKTATVGSRTYEYTSDVTWYQAAIRAARQIPYTGVCTVTVKEGGKTRELDVRCESLFIVDDVRDVTGGDSRRILENGK